MNADQKKRAKELLAAWRATTYALHADSMADLLQELADAPEPEPVLVVETKPGYWNRDHYYESTKSYIDPTKVWGLPVGTKLYTAPPAPSVPETEPVAYATGYYAGYLSIATVDGRALPAGTALYAAPPHQSEHHLEMVNTPAPSAPDGWRPFLTDVITAAGLLEHGKRDKGLAGRIGKFAFDAMRAAPTPAEPPTDLPTWENGDDPLVGGGLISRGVVDFAIVGTWPTKPAPSVPDEQLQAAFDRGFKAGNEQGIAQQIEIHKLHDLLAAPTPAEAPADLVQDSVASEPVGYLYTNLQSGEYHVSDYDDDYRGPERALWCIEPVYRRARGQS